MMDWRQKVEESNRIEGITTTTNAEIEEHQRFVALQSITIEELQAFVRVVQPDAVLRDQVGRDVRIGSHCPPRGGPKVRQQLQALLDDANAAYYRPFEIHVRYEMLHPFTDGNGRSGRALWYWQMHALGYGTTIGFLHSFYYQALQDKQKS